MSTPEPPPRSLLAANQRQTGLFLSFDNAEHRRPVEIGSALIDVEDAYWLCLSVPGATQAALARMPPSGHPEPVDQLHMRTEYLHLGSPLDVLLSLPPVIWATGSGFTFVGVLAVIFHLPARYQQEREAFWNNRLAADRVKRQWVDEKEAEYDGGINLRDLALPEEAKKSTDPDPED